MSNCKQCGTPVKTFTKRGKPHKYCDDKCAQEFYKTKKSDELREKLDPPTPCKACGTLIQRHLSNKPRKYCPGKCTKTPNWLRIEKKNAWIDEHCVSKEEIANMLGVHTGTITNRMRKLGLKEHYKVVDGLNYTYVAKIDIDPIKNIHRKKKIPDGFTTLLGAAKLLNIKKSSVKKKIAKIIKRTGKNPVEKIYVQIAHAKTSNVYTAPVYKIEDLKKIKTLYKERTFTCDHCGKETTTIYEDKKYCSVTCSKAAQRMRTKQRRANKLASEGYISLDKSVINIGCTKAWLRNQPEATTLYSKIWVKKADFDNLTERWIDFDSTRSERLQNENKQSRIIKRSDNWQYWANREMRLVNSFPEKLRKCELKYGVKHKETENLMVSIHKNLGYHQFLLNHNAAVLLDCSECNEQMPFYDFRFAGSKGAKSGRETKCRKCVSLRTKYDPQVAKEKLLKNYKGRMRSRVAISVKQHIGRLTREYPKNISTTKVWNAIEKQCNYDVDQLVEHIQALFTDKMNWQNQKTPRSPGEFGWHMDHIDAHSNFQYDSLDHPDFAKCWALKNLRPMEAIMNIQKGDKKLYQNYQVSFRKGVELALKGKKYAKGVWKHLEYSNLEAKNFLEKKFAAVPGANWGNWGPVWQLDHIDPVAHLAFVSPNCSNFKKCWGLDNLQPLSREKNASKGSKWKNKRWLHNYN